MKSERKVGKSDPLWSFFLFLVVMDTSSISPHVQVLSNEHQTVSVEMFGHVTTPVLHFYPVSWHVITQNGNLSHSQLKNDRHMTEKHEKTGKKKMQPNRQTKKNVFEIKAQQGNDD